MAKLLVFTVLLCAVAAQIGVHAAAGPYCNMMEMICKDRTSCYNIAGRCDGEKDCADGSDEAGCNALPHTTLGINGTVTVRAQYKSHFQDSDTNAVELLLCSSKGDCSLVSVFGHYYDGSLGYFTWTGCNMWGRECARQNSGSHGFVYDLPSGEVAVQVQRRPTEFVVWRLDNPEDVATVPIEGDHNALMVRTYRMWEFMPVQFS